MPSMPADDRARLREALAVVHTSVFIVRREVAPVLDSERLRKHFARIEDHLAKAVQALERA